MKFTTLHSFANHLSAVMLPLFAQASSPTRTLLDNSWIVWQLAWLYPDDLVISEDLRSTIGQFLSQGNPAFGLNEEVRRQWMAHLGVPAERRILQRSWGTPQLLLKKILSEVLPQETSHEEKVIQYLLSMTGLPERRTATLRSWLENSSSSLRGAAQGAEPPTSEFAWLNAAEVENELNATTRGRQVLETGALQILTLPAALPRPASFMLPDKSLWLLWPDSNERTSIHPIMQKALLSHEAAHLQRNRAQTIKTIHSDSDTIWESEKDALVQEWFSLLSLFQSENIENRQELWQKWLNDNGLLQKMSFQEDWHAYHAPQASIVHLRPHSGWISLPFSSAVYACLSEDLFQTGKSSGLNPEL
ncbi:MAG: hypothetical protein RIR26_1543 [Pseudomonadota bacterium]